MCPVSCVTVDTSGRTVENVPLEGGHLALDFANTVGGLRDEPPSPDDEYLESYEDVATWLRRIYTDYDFQVTSNWLYNLADPVIGAKPSRSAPLPIMQSSLRLPAIQLRASM